MLGIHGDPIASRKRIDAARRKGERFEGEAYSYPRAFSYVPDAADRAWFAAAQTKLGIDDPNVLDPTAGGGSIPFESARLGLRTFGNDLNPVATLIERATIEFPLLHGVAVKREFERLAAEFLRRREERMLAFFPPESAPRAMPTNFIWARTIRCPYCAGVVPLSPNWRLASDGTGVKLVPNLGTGLHDEARHVAFEIVKSAKEQASGTVSGGDATCPYADCGRLISGDVVKLQAQAGEMGEQLYAVVYKQRVVVGHTKSGKPKEKWVRGYRAPRSEDDMSALVRAKLDEKMPEWEALDIVPSESIGELSNYDRGHRMYGMYRWIDMYSPRQLLAHCTSVEAFRELLTEEDAAGHLNDTTKAAFVYLSFALDKLRDYNSRATRWIVQREVMANTFDSHNFAMKWSYTEMASLVKGIGYDWAIDQVGKCIGELVDLIRPRRMSKPLRQFDLALAEAPAPYFAPRRPR